jgi:carbamoyltransferase
MSKPIYVLGTGLSHDGSSCLLKDGKIIVAIEKERLSRRKHDGGNDSLTVQYCLDQAGITIDDLSLVVQAAHFEKESIRKDSYSGKRLFDADSPVPFVTISHHLAHAWSAIGTSPFTECNVMIIDGSGSFYAQCDDLAHAVIPADVNTIPGIYAERDSFYFFNGKEMQPLYKDFSLVKYDHKPGEVYLPTARHSIGGLYAMASNYCFGDFHQAGKLMGLAPYGNRAAYTEELFILHDGRYVVNEELMRSCFTRPVDLSGSMFKDNFQYYADIARWVQEEAERAILYLFEHRMKLHPHGNISYAGGVALNAVTNTRIKQLPGIKTLYIEPAAGDNGLAIGCAFYGWMQVLQKEKVKHDGSTFFGRPYQQDEVITAIEAYAAAHPEKIISYKKEPGYIDIAAGFLASGKTIGWFQSGAEFGPRALGRRSILANPAVKNIQQHINHDIKFREDFRPFAPAVLYDDKDLYFQMGLESPYMILIDKIRDEWKDKMPGIVHVDGSCRVQTVRDNTEPLYKLLESFKKITGSSVLLNTSFNCKGMPIVETPGEAIDFFYACDLDVLVLDDYIIVK